MHAAAPSLSATLLQRAPRSPDPSLLVHDRWFVRRVAPEVVRLKLSHLGKSRPALSIDLIRVMGFEAANIHLGTKSSAELRLRLTRLVEDLGANWLGSAAEGMLRATCEDQVAWKEHWTRHARSAKRSKPVAERT